MEFSYVIVVTMLFAVVVARFTVLLIRQRASDALAQVRRAAAAARQEVLVAAHADNADAEEALDEWAKLVTGVHRIPAVPASEINKNRGRLAIMPSAGPLQRARAER